MRVSIADIREKAEKLSPGYEQYVNWDGSSIHAEVTSINKPLDGEAPVYTVSIRPAKQDGYLDVVCPCRASKLCYHLAMFYGVAKKIGTETATPVVEAAEDTAKPIESPKPNKQAASRMQSLQTISEGIEKLVDGMAQLSRIAAREESKIVVAEMLRKGGGDA